MTRSEVREMLPAEGDRQAAGIVARPSGSFPSPLGEPSDPSTSRRSNLVVDKSAVSGARGAGILVEGSDATILRVIRAVF